MREDAAGGPHGVVGVVGERPDRIAIPGPPAVEDFMGLLRPPRHARGCSMDERQRDPSRTARCHENPSILESGLAHEQFEA